jgi:hypothetical protein
VSLFGGDSTAGLLLGSNKLAYCTRTQLTLTRNCPTKAPHRYFHQHHQNDETMTITPKLPITSTVSSRTTFHLQRRPNQICIDGSGSRVLPLAPAPYSPYCGSHERTLRGRLSRHLREGTLTGEMPLLSRVLLRLWAALLSICLKYI